jgi:tRNA U34 5-carboxymethylaminomethyl modifying enzyme MnmG/GidA
MTDPATLTAAAIATLIITKAFEKTGERLGEKVLEEGSNLLSLLRHKDPETATVIELAQEQPLNYGQAVLEKIEAAAKTDPEIAQSVKQVEAVAQADPKYLQALQGLENAIKSQPSSIIHNYGPIAKVLPNLKAVFQGSIIHGGVHIGGG